LLFGCCRAGHPYYPPYMGKSGLGALGFGLGMMLIFFYSSLMFIETKEIAD